MGCKNISVLLGRRGQKENPSRVLIQELPVLSGHEEHFMSQPQEFAIWFRHALSTPVTRALLSACGFAALCSQHRKSFEDLSWTPCSIARWPVGRAVGGKHPYCFESFY